MHKDTFISFDENILSNRKIHKRRYLSLKSFPQLLNKRNKECSPKSDMPYFF